MNTHASKTSENTSQSVPGSLPKLQGDNISTLKIEDNRPEAIAQRKLKEAITNSAGVQQLKALQEMADSSPQVKQLKAYQAMADNFIAQRKESVEEKPVQKAANNTGLPDNLKSGIENLSGYSMNDVKVHFNSDKPAQLNAHAYAQGTDIHLGSGQEKHLPHEAWHVVQQKQGRVKPTLQMKGKVDINDDAGLEQEADTMGAKALSAGQMTVQKAEADGTNNSALSLSVPAQRVVQRVELASDKLNVAGEHHSESGVRRVNEAAYATEIAKGGYWTEAQFKVSGVSAVSADDFALRAKQLIAFAQKADLGKWLSMDTDALVAGLISKKVDVSVFETPLKLFRPEELEFYKDHIPEEVYNEYNETLLNKIDVFEKGINSIKTSLAEYLSSKSVQWKTTLEEAVGVVQLTFGVVDIQIQHVTEALGIISAEDISLQRSRKMHEAANNRAATLGLWKIGDNHAVHMQTMGAKAYKHILKDDFNTGFDLFMARRNMLGKIRTLANGNWGPYTTGRSKPTGVSAIAGIISGAGVKSTATVLGEIKTRATQDNGRASKNRHKKTKDFYAALSAMDVNNTVSLITAGGLMDGIVL